MISERARPRALVAVRAPVAAAIRAPAAGSPGRATALAPPPDGPGQRGGGAGQGAGRLVRTARRHWMVLILLTAGLGLRVVTQLAYRPALLYIDSYKYLTGTAGSDPAGYGILLRPLLWVGNLAVVAGFQHLLGLAMALALYTTLIRRHAPRWAATLAAAPLLLDAYQLQMEQTIMPDVTFEALITAGLTIFLWHPRPGLWQVAAGALVLGLATDVRQIGELLIIPVVVFAVLSARGWRRLSYLAVAAACFAVPVAGYMTVSWATGNGFGLTSHGVNVLYGRAAVAANCTTLQLPSAERSLCPSPAVAAWGIDRIINNADGPYQSYKAPPGKTVAQATDDFDFTVLKQQPLAIPLSVLRDAARLFALTRDGAPNITQISRWQFQPDYPAFPPGVTLHFVARQAQRYGGGTPVAVKPLASFLRAYQLNGGYTPGPLLAVMTAAGTLGSLFVLSWRKPRRRRSDSGAGDGRPLAVAAMLATLAAVAVVLGSDVYEFSWRYQLPALVILPVAGSFGYVVITRRVRQRLTRRRSGGQQPQTRACSGRPANRYERQGADLADGHRDLRLDRTCPSSRRR